MNIFLLGNSNIDRTYQDSLRLSNSGIAGLFPAKAARRLVPMRSESGYEVGCAGHSRPDQTDRSGRWRCRMFDRAWGGLFRETRETREGATRQESRRHRPQLEFLESRQLLTA